MSQNNRELPDNLGNQKSSKGQKRKTAPSKNTKKKQTKDLSPYEDNMTLEQVADYLTKNNIPTFSGRGRWHAQTIHRLAMYPS